MVFARGGAQPGKAGRVAIYRAHMFEGMTIAAAGAFGIGQKVEAM